MTGIGGDALDERPPVYKAVGVALAIASGVFIGVSFVLKKKGLLAANLKDNKEAGEGYGYLKNVWWWAGMILSEFLRSEGLRGCKGGRLIWWE